MSKWHIPGLLIIGLAVLALASHVRAEPSYRTSLYLFWGEGCRYCAAEKEFLPRLEKRYPDLDVRTFEVWHNEENAALFSRVLNAAGVLNPGVPVTIVGDRMWVGFSERTANEIARHVERCIREGCPDVGKALQMPQGDGRERMSVSVPFIGEVSAEGLSLPVFTVTLALMDSFNPCAFFVLFFLLSLLVHAESRGRMLLVGGTFVCCSGLVYFVFMAAWLNVFMLMGQLALITAVAGGVALVVAAINIKDFFWLKQGVSLGISNRARTRLVERMRGIIRTASVPSALLGTAALALAANTYELLCTAGFPMVYTRVLTLQELDAWTYYAYLAFYNMVYVIPLMGIVGAFIFTLGTRRLTQWKGRKLKLVSGMMMLCLGMVLLVYPDALGSVASSALILALALGLSWTIITVAKRLRPEWTHG